VLRPGILLFVVILALTGCNNGMQDKAKVHQAILERLRTKSGLDLKSLDVNTTSVTFDKNKAYATVSFHPKGDPTLNSGLAMKYTLEQRDGKWEVVGAPTAVGQGHGGDAGQLPSGHPNVGNLPPGHPQVSPGSAGSGGEGRPQ
jgi:hypothetical protein